MSRFCLDTCAYSNFKRGHAEAVRLVASASWVGVPAVVLGELRTGFLAGRHAQRNEEELRQFLDHPAVSVIDVTDEVAHTYAELLQGLRKAGTPVPTNDIWIAATAASAGVPVLTFDRHFECVVRSGVHVLK